MPRAAFRCASRRFSQLQILAYISAIVRRLFVFRRLSMSMIPRESERRESECRAGRDGGDAHPKPEVAPPVVREVPVAGRAARAVSKVAERPATHHPEDVIPGFQILPPIGGFVRIPVYRAKNALSP